MKIRELIEAAKELAAASARIVEDDAHPTLVHMRELNRCRRRVAQLLEDRYFQHRYFTGKRQPKVKSNAL